MDQHKDDPRRPDGSQDKKRVDIVDNELPVVVTICNKIDKSYV